MTTARAVVRAIQPYRPYLPTLVAVALIVFA